MYLTLLFIISLFLLFSFRRLNHINSFIAYFIWGNFFINFIAELIFQLTWNRELTLFQYYYINLFEIIFLSYIYFPVNKRKFVLFSSIATSFVLFIALLKLDTGPLITNVCTHIYLMYLAGYNVYKRIFDSQGNRTAWIHYLIISYYAVTLIFSFLINIFDKVSPWEASFLLGLNNVINIVYFLLLWLWTSRNQKVFVMPIK